MAQPVCGSTPDTTQKTAQLTLLNSYPLARLTAGVRLRILRRVRNRAEEHHLQPLRRALLHPGKHVRINESQRLAGNNSWVAPTLLAASSSDWRGGYRGGSDPQKAQ